MSVEVEEAAIPPTPHHWPWGLVAGLGFALAALLAAALADMRIRWPPYGEGGDITAINLFAGVFLCGWLLWWLLVARPGRLGLIRGAVVGVLTACISYPAVLLLAEFFQSDWLSRSDAPTLLERMGHVLVLSAFGILTTGFAATTTLALAGMAIAILQSRLTTRQRPTALDTPRPRGRLRFIFRALALCAASIVVLLVGSFIFLSLLPVRPLSASIPAPPATSHAEALAAFAAIEESEAALALHPSCGWKLLTHGEKVERAVIFFHGLTNCPAQADELAPWLYDLGYNVLVPRLPGNGEADPLTLALADVTAEDFLETAEASIALASGLGDEVIILGLSAGGTITAYQTQHDDRVTTSVSIAPFLAPGGVPPWAAQAATNLLLWLPNMMIWWDPSAPYVSPEMDHAYPRFATRAIGETMRLGRIVSAEANAGMPAAPHIGFLLNDADLDISNRLVEEVAAAWRQRGHEVEVRILPEAEGLPHDLIDPRQPDAAVDIVYPILLDMISAGRP